MRRVAHSTLAMQKAALVAQEFRAYAVGDRVLTRDGLAGVIASVSDGPYARVETYDVVLDRGLGGGTYSVGELSPAGSIPRFAARARPVALVAEADLDPVESAEIHLASQDYAELGTILFDRPPLENVDFSHLASTHPHTVKVAARMERRRLPLTDLLARSGDMQETMNSGRTSESPGEPIYVKSRDDIPGKYELSDGHHRVSEAIGRGETHIDADIDGPDDEPLEPPWYDFSPHMNPHTAAKETTAPDDVTPHDGSQLMDVHPNDPPDACSACGGTEFGEPQNTGRGERVQCAQCGQTMTSWGGQWAPDPPNAPANDASGQADPRARTNTQPDQNDNDVTLTIKHTTAARDFDPPQIGMFGDDATIHHHDFPDHDDPVNWPDSQWADAQRRVLPPTHELHTTQEGWVPFGTSAPDGDPDGDHYLKHPANYDESPDHELPKTVRMGGKDWIAHGHHRLLADRRLGRPTTVLHKDMDTERNEGHTASRRDPDLGFEMLATWADVRAKAKRIKDSGGVRILAANSSGVVGEVQGDTAVYESQFTYVPTRKAIAMWHCSCFLADAPVMMADGTERPISQMQEGDLVFTHQGRAAQVTKVWPQPWDGGLVSLQVAGENRRIQATDSHPFWVADMKWAVGHSSVAAGTRYDHLGSVHPVAGKVGWRPAGQIAVGDYVSFAPPVEEQPLVLAYQQPRTPARAESGHHGVGKWVPMPSKGLPKWVARVWDRQDERYRVLGYFPFDDAGKLRAAEVVQAWFAEHDTHEIKVDQDVAWLLGMYAAEGFCVDATVVGFALGNHEQELATRIQDICEREFGTRGSVRMSPSGTNSLDLRVSSWLLRALCADLVGTGVKTKKLDGRLLVLPIDLQMEFIRGVDAGDGTLATPGTHGHRAKRHQIGLANETLIRQMRVMLTRLGIRSSVYYQSTNAGGLASTVNGGAFWRLSWTEHTKWSSRQFWRDGRMWSRVLAAQTEHYQGEVWDMEVADDHSFVAFGLGVHNCKWGSYSWGRSPAYRRFEGRPCSHLEALRFESQSRGMFGRTVSPDTTRLPGQHPHTPVTVEYDRTDKVNRNRRTVPPGNMRQEWHEKSRVRTKNALLDHVVGANGSYSGLTFDHHSDTEVHRGGNAQEIRAHHPQHGTVGTLSYTPFNGPDPAEPNDDWTHVEVNRLDVPEEHRRRGVGSALMDELHQVTGDDVGIDHGDRSENGREWARGYFGEHGQDEQGRRATSVQLHQASRDLAPVHVFATQMVRDGAPLPTVMRMLASHGVPSANAARIITWAVAQDDATEDEDGDADDAEDDIPGMNDRDSTELSTQPGHRWHHTNDTRRHAPEVGVGINPLVGPLMDCDQCGGSGCGHCSGVGQVIVPGGTPTGGMGVGDMSTTTSPTSGISVDDGSDSAGGISATGNYAVGDSFTSGEPAPDDYQAVIPSASKNPGSTGWATGEDPKHWERTVITNGGGGMGVWDASRHQSNANRPWDNDQDEMRDGVEDHGGIPVAHPDDTPYHDDDRMQYASTTREKFDPHGEDYEGLQGWLNKDTLNHFADNPHELTREPVTVLHDMDTDKKYLVDGHHRAVVMRALKIPGHLDAIVHHASHHTAAEHGTSDVCGGCGEHIHATGYDDVPWVHSHTGNSYCDVHSTDDAALLRGSPLDRGEAAPIMHEASFDVSPGLAFDDVVNGSGTYSELRAQGRGAFSSQVTSPDYSDIGFSHLGVSAASLPSVAHIVGLGAGEQVPEVLARGVVTGVTNVQATGVAHVMDVPPPMSLGHPGSVTGRVRPVPEQPVPVFLSTTSPGMTSVRPAGPVDHRFVSQLNVDGYAASTDPSTFSHVANDSEKKSDPPTVSGVALKASDTGRVLMIQRSNSDEKDPAAGTWEFPGGHHEDGDKTSLHAALREFQEEVGHPFPEGGHLTGVHRSGPYLLHTVVVPDESSPNFADGRRTVNPDDPHGDEHEQSAWWDPEHARKNPALRSELKGSPAWSQITKAAIREPGSSDCPACHGTGDVNDGHECERCDGSGYLTPHEAILNKAARSYGNPMGEQDWDIVHGDLPEHIHRGIGVNLPDDLHRFVHDERQPEADRAKALLRHVQSDAARSDQSYPDDRHGLGTSWSGDDGVAEGFAEESAKRSHVNRNHQRAQETNDHTWGTDDYGDPVAKPATAVVITAHKPDREEIDEDPNGDGSGMRYTYHGHGEREVPLYGGAYVGVHSIRWRPVRHWSDPKDVTDPETFTHHQFTETQHHEAILNDHPEPALPFTEGADDEPEQAVDASAHELGATAALEAATETTDIVAAFRATAGGRALATEDTGSEDGESGPSNADIAANARAVLAKTAMADFSFAEQQELISEGAVEKTRARNYDALDLTGTHYAALDDEEHNMDDELMLL